MFKVIDLFNQTVFICPGLPPSSFLDLLVTFTCSLSTSIPQTCQKLYLIKNIYINSKKNVKQ